MIEVKDLLFSYGGVPALSIDQLVVPAGSRCLLVGRNGAGKTTLLEILAGRRLVPQASVQILGRPAFEDPSLVHEVAYVGQVFAFKSDILVREILAKQEYDQARLDELVQVLGVDLNWSLWRVSSGQRRRIHLLLTLLQPKRVLLIDEATSELDLIARLDLLDYLERDSTARRSTIVYASHVFDGLERWPTHLLWLKRGAVASFALRDASASLLGTVEAWLRSDV